MEKDEKPLSIQRASEKTNPDQVLKFSLRRVAAAHHSVRTLLYLFFNKEKKKTKILNQFQSKKKSQMHKSKLQKLQSGFIAILQRVIPLNLFSFLPTLLQAVL